MPTDVVSSSYQILCLKDFKDRSTVVDFKIIHCLSYPLVKKKIWLQLSFR